MKSSGRKQSRKCRGGGADHQAKAPRPVQDVTVNDPQKNDSPVADLITDRYTGRNGPSRSSKLNYHRGTSKKKSNQPFRPLAASNDSIRVVKVLANLDEYGRIQCEVRHATVKSAYTAISYEWGVDHTRDIQFNGQRFSVRENLYQFLECARTTHAEEWLWIDALCIDQANFKEKQHQVKRMGDVFFGAQQVLSFIPLKFQLPLIGGTPEMSKDTIWEFLIRLELNSALSDRFVKHASFPWLDENCEWKRDDFVDGIIKFCQSTYWERLWIIQEVAWAQELRIFDGTRSISWHKLQMVLQAAVHHAPTDQKKQQLVTSIPFRINELRTETRRTSLLALLADFGTLKCSNFRDRVYGLRSLASQGHHLQIKYRINLLTLFFDTLRFCQRYGASFPEETMLFPGARRLCKTFRVSPESLEIASLSDRTVANIRCRAVESSFTTVATTVAGYGTRCLLECRHCHRQTSYCSKIKKRTLFCLAAEGARVHLLSFPNATGVKHQKRDALLILTFLPDENVTDSGEPAEQMGDVVTIVSSPPAPNSPYLVVCLTPTGFLRVLRYERTNSEDLLPRSQQLCMMSAGSPDGETSDESGE